MTDNGDTLELEFLSQLKFYDTKFSYKNKSYDYTSVIGLEYYAVRTKHSVNFIPTGESHEAYIKLHFFDGEKIKIDQERKLFGDDKVRSEAVMKAANILEEITFTDRYQQYEEQFKKKNFVQFHDIQLHRDGDIFFRGERISTVDLPPSIGPV